MCYEQIWIFCDNICLPNTNSSPAGNVTPFGRAPFAFHPRTQDIIWPSSGWCTRSGLLASWFSHKNNTHWLSVWGSLLRLWTPPISAFSFVQYILFILSSCKTVCFTMQVHSDRVHLSPPPRANVSTWTWRQRAVTTRQLLMSWEWQPHW